MNNMKENILVIFYLFISRHKFFASYISVLLLKYILTKRKEILFKMKEMKLCNKSSYYLILCGLCNGRKKND